MDQLMEFRKLFNDAHRSKEQCQQLLSAGESAKTVIENGYKIAGEMISTKFMFNPIASMKIYNEGKRKLEELLDSNPAETELIYIRYTIQKNTPRFIGYYRNLATDRDCLMEFMQIYPKSDLTQHMLIYFKDTKDISEGELKEIGV